MVKKGAKTPRARRKSETENPWILSLYVMDEAPRSRNAIENLHNICERYLKGHYRIKVIDLSKHPELAVRDRIVAIPTLIRVSPPLDRRIIGDLSNQAKVMKGLEMPAHPFAKVC